MGFGTPVVPMDLSTALPLVVLLPEGNEGLASFSGGLDAPTGFRAGGLGKAVFSLSFRFSNLVASLSVPELTF